MHFCEPKVSDWLLGCSAVEVSLGINTTQCLRFETPVACSWQLGAGLEETKDKSKMWKGEGIG